MTYVKHLTENWMGWVVNSDPARRLIGVETVDGFAWYPDDQFETITHAQYISGAS